MNFQRAGRILLPTLKVVLWGFFFLSIFKSFEKVIDKQFGFTTSTEEDGFEMPSISFCAVPLPTTIPTSFDDLYTKIPKVKGHGLVNASIFPRKYFSEEGM